MPRENCVSLRRGGRFGIVNDPLQNDMENWLISKRDKEKF